MSTSDEYLLLNIIDEHEVVKDGQTLRSWSLSFVNCKSSITLAAAGQESKETIWISGNSHFSMIKKKIFRSSKSEWIVKLTVEIVELSLVQVKENCET